MFWDTNTSRHLATLTTMDIIIANMANPSQIILAPVTTRPSSGQSIDKANHINRPAETMNRTVNFQWFFM
jgi:hypothetical protein